MNLPVCRYNTSLTYVHYIEITSVVECAKYGISMGNIFHAPFYYPTGVSC